MAIDSTNQDKIVTLGGLNTFRTLNALDHFAKQTIGAGTGSPSEVIVIKKPDLGTGIQIGSNSIQLANNTNIVGTLSAQAIKQDGQDVALASQIPADLEIKLEAITWHEETGGYTIGNYAKILNLVGTGIYLNGNNLEFSYATADDINAIFS